MLISYYGVNIMKSLLSYNLDLENNYFSSWQIKIILSHVPSFVESRDIYLYKQLAFLRNIENNRQDQVISDLYDSETINTLHGISLNEGLKLARSQNNPLLVKAFFQLPLIERIISRENTGEIDRVIIWAAEKGHLSVLKLIAKNHELIRDITNKTFETAFVKAIINWHFNIIEFFISEVSILAKISLDAKSYIREHLEDSLIEQDIDYSKNLDMVIKNKFLVPYMSKNLVSKIIKFSLANDNFVKLEQDLGAQTVSEEFGKIFIESLETKSHKQILNLLKFNSLISKELKSQALGLLIKKKKFSLALKLFSHFYF